MTRETKLGLVVAGSFVCLVGVVVFLKWKAEPPPVPDLAGIENPESAWNTPLAAEGPPTPLGEMSGRPVVGTPVSAPTLAVPSVVPTGPAVSPPPTPPVVPSSPPPEPQTAAPSPHRLDPNLITAAASDPPAGTPPATSPGIATPASPPTSIGRTPEAPVSTPTPPVVSAPTSATDPAFIEIAGPPKPPPSTEDTAAMAAPAVVTAPTPDQVRTTTTTPASAASPGTFTMPPPPQPPAHPETPASVPSPATDTTGRGTPEQSPGARLGPPSVPPVTGSGAVPSSAPTRAPLASDGNVALVSTGPGTTTSPAPGFPGPAAAPTSPAPLGAPATVSAPPIAVPTPPGSSPRPVAPLTPVVKAFDEETYICKPGDTFESIAQQHYHGTAYAAALLMYNRTHPMASDTFKHDPQPQLQPNQPIYIPQAKVLEDKYPNLLPNLTPLPSAPPTAAPPANSSSGFGAAQPKRYKVTGTQESFYSIAIAKLKDGNRWGQIRDLNPNVNPAGFVPPGTDLLLPADAEP